MSSGSPGPRPDYGARLGHMRDAARLLLRISAGKQVERLRPDSETSLALTRLLGILGEAARHVSATTRARHPEVPWQDIADTRNRIVHGYFEVDHETIAAIIRNDLPLLLPQLEATIGAPDGRRGVVQSASEQGRGPGGRPMAGPEAAVPLLGAALGLRIRGGRPTQDPPGAAARRQRGILSGALQEMDA